MVEALPALDMRACLRVAFEGSASKSGMGVGRLILKLHHACGCHLFSNNDARQFGYQPTGVEHKHTKRREPLHASGGVSCHCCVVHISLYREHSGNAIKISQDRVHGYTEKKDRERSSHIHTCDNRF